MEANQSSPALPSCIETRGDGAIAIRGHRVTLYVLLDAIYGKTGVGLVQLQSFFPTIDRENLVEVMEYSQRPEARAFYEGHRRVAAENREQISATGPSLRDLRNRRSSRRSTT